jgi:hypothetical protein
MEDYLLETINLHKCVKDGCKGKPLRTIFDAMRHTNIRGWVRDLRDKNSLAYSVLLLNLGSVLASSFVERLFSTSKQVWSSSNSRLKMEKYEKKTILRQNKKLMRTLRKKGVRADVC